MSVFKNTWLFLVLFLAFGCTKSGTPNPEIPDGTDPHEATRQEYGLGATTNLWGFVKDEQGNPIEKVAVTDGFSVAQTDAKGLYQLRKHEKARFIYYTTPADFEITVDAENHPLFYTKIDQRTSLFRQDFTLTRSTKEEDWALIAIGDPQTSNTDNIARFKDESLADTDRTIRQLKAEGLAVYAVTLGDIVHDKPDLYPAMKAVMSRREAPIFQVLGNHDHALNTPDDKAHEVFEDHFGPRNYSFQRGNAHIVIIDNYINLNNLQDKPTGGLTDDIWKWLQADLALVPKDRMVILCAHVPFRQGTVATHGRNVVNLLKTFHQAHIMTGHTHTNEKWKHDDQINSQLMEHTHGTTCGAHWRSNVCLDGTPNGYGVYHIKNNEISDYYYKATGEQFDRNYQMRVYDGAHHFYSAQSGYTFNLMLGAAQNRVVANIWNADPTWEISLIEEGQAPVTMVQTTTALTDWAAYSYHLHFKDKLWTGETEHYWHARLPSGKTPAEATFAIVAKDLRNNQVYSFENSPANLNVQYDYKEIAYP